MKGKLSFSEEHLEDELSDELNASKYFELNSEYLENKHSLVMHAAKEAIWGVIHQRLTLVCTKVVTDIKPLRLIGSTMQLMMIRYIRVATLCL